MNLAEPGYNTEDELAVLREALANGKFVPSVVVFQFGANDFRQNLNLRIHLGGLYFYEREQTLAFVPPRGLYQFLLDHSNLFYRLNRLAVRAFGRGRRLFTYPNRYAEVRRALYDLRGLARTHHFSVVFLNLPYDRRFHPPTRSDRVVIDSYDAIFRYSLDLRQEMEGEPSYWLPDGSHPSAAGHAHIAERLYGYLKEQKLC
jgi:hypothetical protein